MKILYVVTGLGLGGAEKVVVSLADQMINRGHEVAIVYLRGKAFVKPSSEQVNLIGLDLNKLTDLFSANKKYKDILINFKPDVVHAHMIHANVFARINRVRSQGSKLICSAHNSNEGGKFRMLAYRLTNFLSDINTNVSVEATKALISKGAFTKDNISTVYNGIDLKVYQKENDFYSDDEIKFLSVGRLSDQKDYPNLLNAIYLLKSKLGSNIKFYIAGDGELHREIENLITELSIQEFVVLLGKRQDIPKLLNEANFFILPSKHEGLPTVVLEAMACQTYVIATNCGGCAEIMGNTGKLIPIMNSVALSNAIEEVLALPLSSIQDNNYNARKIVESKFSLNVAVEKWLELYEE